MAEMTCEQCKATLDVGLFGTVYPGGKEREQAYCPLCGFLVHEEMTSQHLGVTLIAPPEGLGSGDQKN